MKQFKAGKWYRYAERIKPELEHGKSMWITDMEHVTDGVPRKCTYGEGTRAAFTDTAPNTWNWELGFENWERVRSKPSICRSLWI